MVRELVAQWSVARSLSQPQATVLALVEHKWAWSWRRSCEPHGRQRVQWPISQRTARRTRCLPVNSCEWCYEASGQSSQGASRQTPSASSPGLGFVALARAIGCCSGGRGAKLALALECDDNWAHRFAVLAIMTVCSYRGMCHPGGRMGHLARHRQRGLETRSGLAQLLQHLQATVPATMNRHRS